MAKCKICGKRFDKEEAEERFCIEFPIYDYNNFNTTLCGDCAIEVIEDLEDGYLFGVSVNPDYQGLGLGSKLMKEIEFIAKKVGVKTLYLRPNSEEVMQFYNKKPLQSMILVLQRNHFLNYKTILLNDFFRNFRL